MVIKEFMESVDVCNELGLEVMSNAFHMVSAGQPDLGGLVSPSLRSASR